MWYIFVNCVVDDVTCDITCLQKSHQFVHIAHGKKIKNLIMVIMEIALSNFYQLLTKWEHHKTCSAVTFLTLGFMWELLHKK